MKKDESPEDIRKELRLAIKASRKAGAEPAGKTSKRPSGAQRGNMNNLRHGFYLECFTDAEKKLLHTKFNVEDELKLLRVKALRLAKLTPLNSIAEEELTALDRLYKAVQEMNTIERTKLLGLGHGGELGKSILEALDEMDPYDIDI